MRVTVAPGQWPGDDLEAVLAAVDLAGRVGADGVWLSEVNGYDAVALAVLAAARHPDLRITLGPLAAAVRSPAQTAMAAATVAALSRKPVRVALGAANRQIVGAWHGRRTTDLASQVGDHAAALRQALAGGRTGSTASRDFKLAVRPPPYASIAVAALGPCMLDIAGRMADTAVLNLVPPDLVPAMAERIAAAAAAVGRDEPGLAVWTVVGDPATTGRRVQRFLQPYTRAAGYAAVLASAGVGPDASAERRLQVLTSLGPPDRAVQRLAAYAEAGVGELTAVLSSQDHAAEEVVRALVESASRGSGRTREHR